nr:G-protein coupled receptor [Ipomoea batatas]
MVDRNLNTDTVVRFCKDVQSRSQMGYVDFGRYDKFNYFVAGSGNVSFVQEYFNGDLLNCEMTFDKMGRTAQVELDVYAVSLMSLPADLYATAVASLSSLVQKASVKVYPEQGLKVTLSESTANGVSPTTLSPTILAIDWRCIVTYK